MASVTFPTHLGGSGKTISDDADPNTGLANGGHRLRFVPALQGAVDMARTASDKAQQTAADRQQTGEDRVQTGEDRLAAEQARQQAEGLYGDLDAVENARDAAALSAYLALTSEQNAATSVQQAAQHEANAEAARDAAQLAGGVFVDTAAGLAATNSGEYFTVPDPDAPDAFLVLYRNDSGSAIHVKTYPSLNGIAAAMARLNRKQTRLNRSLVRLGDHGQTLHGDFTYGAYGLGTRDAGGIEQALEGEELLTVQRASPKWVWNASGQLVEVPVDQLAHDYDPVTGEPLGVLIESSATNINPHSDYSDTLTIAGSAGVVEADVILGAQATKYSGENIRRRASVGKASDDTGFRSTISFLVRSVSHNIPLLVQFAPGIGSTAGSDNIQIDFDTQNVLHTPRDPGGDFAIVDLSHTWLTSDTVKIVATVENGINRSFGGLWVGSEGFSGDFSVGGIQHEVGETATSYIPTNGSPVTRAADSQISFTPGNENNIVQGTWAIDLKTEQADVGVGTGALARVNDIDGTVVYSHNNSHSAVYVAGEKAYDLPRRFTKMGEIDIVSGFTSPTYIRGVRYFPFGMDETSATEMAQGSGVASRSLPRPTTAALDSFLESRPKGKLYAPNASVLHSRAGFIEADKLTGGMEPGQANNTLQLSIWGASPWYHLRQRGQEGQVNYSHAVSVNPINVSGLSKVGVIWVRDQYGSTSELSGVGLLNDKSGSLYEEGVVHTAFTSSSKTMIYSEFDVSTESGSRYIAIAARHSAGISATRSGVLLYAIYVE